MWRKYAAEVVLGPRASPELFQKQDNFSMDHPTEWRNAQGSVDCGCRVLGQAMFQNPFIVSRLDAGLHIAKARRFLPNLNETGLCSE